jgi:hypothetical protein
MDPTVASPAVEEDVPKLPLQLGLRLQQLHPQALRRGDEAGGIWWIDRLGLFDYVASVPGTRSAMARTVRSMISRSFAPPISGQPSGRSRVRRLAEFATRRG